LKKIIINTIREIWKIRFLENILVKITTNKIYGTSITKTPPNHYQYKTGSIRQTQKDGINYELDISDIMDWYIYFGFREPARLKLYDLISEGDIVFDVGANIGDTTLHFAKIIGDNAKVHSFEPDPINHNSIQKNISLNNFKNIILNKIGLGNVKGSFKIHTLDQKNKGMNRIVSDSEDVKNSREIQVTTINEYVKENNIQKLDLIKIDVEGYEFNVLKGSVEVLNRFHPKLFIELDDENLKAQGSSAKKLVMFLLDIGYDIFQAETDEKITSEIDFSHCHYDIVAKDTFVKEKNTNS